MESRKEKRESLTGPSVAVIAPVLDSAGVASEGETFQFTATLMDISRHGIGIASQYFLKVGLVVEISCSESKISFSAAKAQVRYVRVTNRGLRIGLEFLEPIESENF